MSLYDKMTPRQAGIVEMLVRHWSVEDVADLLHVSKRTVEQHADNAAKRCGMGVRQLKRELFAEMIQTKESQ